MSSRFIILCVAVSAIAMSGCATVAPWERGVLAKPYMALDENPQDEAFRQHVFFSKEAASGGYGVGGGGCGCN